jgi:hypothetical protein
MINARCLRIVVPLLLCYLSISMGVECLFAQLPQIRVGEDQTGFVVGDNKARFIPWGVNYDHDETGRLLEDYWESEWDKVVADFREIKALGANVVRIHLQFGKFMESSDKPNSRALAQLAKLLSLAEETKLYLDITGLGCYHKADVPAWYDALEEAERWQAQANFWSAVSQQCHGSSAVFCYDLMNEPVAPAGPTKGKEWLGPAFGGKHFVQWISREQRERPRHEIAAQWIKTLVRAIRQQDQQHLITVGLVDWSLERPGLQSGFVPEKIHAELDFLAVHLYPEHGKEQAALDTLRGFAVGKPIIVEETFPLKCSPDELVAFIQKSRPQACGWISFYWGKPAAEYGQDKLGEAITGNWLHKFSELSPTRSKP